MTLTPSDISLLREFPASTEPLRGLTTEQRRRVEDLPWGLLRDGRRTDLGDDVVEMANRIAALEGERDDAQNAAPAQVGPLKAELYATQQRLAALAMLASDLCDGVEIAPEDALRQLYLTLAAEQGKAEGAPSKHWKPQGLGIWHNTRTGAAVSRGGWPVSAPGESLWTLPNGTHGVSPTARAAMIAADKASGQPVQAPNAEWRRPLRSLIHVLDVIDDRVMLSIPGWRSRWFVERTLDVFAPELRETVARDSYYFGNVNVGAESAEDLAIEVTELAPEPEADDGPASEEAKNAGRASNVLLTLTPHLKTRVEALGYIPGEIPAGLLPWLVALAEEARRSVASMQARQFEDFKEVEALREAVKATPHPVESRPRKPLIIDEASAESLKSLARGEQGRGGLFPDWAVEPNGDPYEGEWPPLKLTQAGEAWLAERTARLNREADARLNALDLRMCTLFTRPTRVESGIDRLIYERDEARKTLDELRTALGNGADDALWPPGKTLGEAVELLATMPFEVRALAKLYNGDGDSWTCLRCGCEWPCDVVTACANCHQSESAESVLIRAGADTEGPRPEGCDCANPPPFPSAQGAWGVSCDCPVHGDEDDIEEEPVP